MNYKDTELLEIRNLKIKHIAGKHIEIKKKYEKKLFEYDIEQFVKLREGDIIYYTKDAGWYASWGYCERAISIRLLVKEKKIKKEVCFSGYAYDDYFNYVELDGLLDVLKNENERLQTFIDKYQPIINKIYEMAEKDNYARTFNEYLEEVENEL